MEILKIDNVEFILDTSPGAKRAKSEESKFVLVKSPSVLAFYEGLCSKQLDGRTTGPKTILEIGMFEGGSLVYFDKLYAPTTLVGIDMRREPIEPLEKYRESRSYIKTYYGRSQDKPGTRTAAQSNFPNGIDLVVDDASHLYEETKTTFENIFPLVKAGGMYVIEDWAWSHDKQQQGEDAVWHSRLALTNLILNLVMMTAVSRVVESVMVTEHLACITKGRGTLPANKLDLSQNLRGKNMPLI